MWFRKSELLAPLTSLTSSKVKFEWRSSHHRAFEKIKIKKGFGTEIQVLLFYPDFNKPVKVKFEWHSSHQQAFDKIKQVIGTEVLLCYPDFYNPFHLYTDASDHQLGVNHAG
jgi:hypothetical protein